MASTKIPPIAPPTPSGESLLPSGPLPGAGVEIEDEADLMAAGGQIRAALRERPQLAGLLFVNPVMVLSDLGFRLSPAMQRHLNRRLGLGADVSQPLAALEQKLRAVIEDPKLSFTNPKHVAKIVFELLELRPRETAGVTPPQRPIEEIVALSGDGGPLLDSERGTVTRPRRPSPARARRFTRRAPTRRGTAVVFPLYQTGLSRIDLDAQLPDLPYTEAPPPAELPLEQLLFYRDDHPVVRDLCEYQMLHRRRLAFATPEQYRKIRDGQAGSMWRSWITGATFPRNRDA